MLCSEKPEDPLASPANSDSESEDDVYTRTGVRESGVFGDDPFSSDSRLMSDGPVTQTANTMDERRESEARPRKVFNTHSPDLIIPALSKASFGTKGGKGKGKMSENRKVKKPCLKREGRSFQKTETVKPAQEQRVGNLRNYTRARLVWDKLVNCDRCTNEDGIDPCAKESTEVVKMVKLGGTYLDDFIKYDGHRKAMAAWRNRTKAEKKQGTAGAPTSITEEYKRVADRYRGHWLKLHGQSGSGVPQKPLVSCERASRASIPSSATSVQDRVSSARKPVSARAVSRTRNAKRPGFVLHGLSGKSNRKSVSDSCSSRKKKDDSRPRKDSVRSRGDTERVRTPTGRSHVVLPEKALRYKPTRNVSTPSFKVKRDSAAYSEGSSVRRSDYRK